MVMLEYANDFGANHDLLHWVSEKVTHKAHITGVWQFNEHRKVRAMPIQCIVRGVPDTLPAVDAAAWGHLLPARVELVALMAEPLWTELPSLAMLAALD